jgi:hypothetical protein
MRRSLALLVAAAALAAPATASGATAGAVLLGCERGDRPAAEFQASMDASPAAARMQMRFALQARLPGRRGYRRVAAPGFGTWATADPGVSRYTFTRRVENLIGPARYRVSVHFRWLDAAGRMVARARARSRSCRQPDLRPDLEVTELALLPSAARDEDRYRVVVRNRGRSPAGAFDLELSVGGAAAATVRVEGIAAGGERLVEIDGPACEPGLEVTATADPGDAVSERSEAGNVLTLTCP